MSRSTSKDLYHPNKDVTNFLINPENALKKDLKPIKTSYSNNRQLPRGLFSSKANGPSEMIKKKAGFESSLGRYKYSVKQQVSPKNQPHKIIKGTQEVKNDSEMAMYNM